MQILIIILIASLFAFQDVAVRAWLTGGGVEPNLPAWARLVVSLAGFVVLILLTFGLQRWARRRVERQGDAQAVVFSERVTSVMLGAILVVQIGNLVFLDWFGLVRAGVGDLVLVDEILALGPAVLAITAVWAAQYPISRLVREVSLIRQLDRGQTIYPIWKRGQFVLLQVRLHFVLILLPILLVIGWRELITKLQLIAGWPSELPAVESVELLALAAGTAGIFILAPLLIRYLWDTQPLPEGELRTRLLEICRIHRLRVRELLVWNTFGALMNGAVMGVVGRIRYILLTDALLDMLSPKQIESVLAHELGHVRHHHLPALILALFAIMISVSLVINLPLSYLSPGGPAFRQEAQFTPLGVGEAAASDWWSMPASFVSGESPSPVAVGSERAPVWLEVVSFTVSMLIILILFGWVSRRFERQADTFAVQHLSGMTRRETDRLLTAEAVEAMAGALGMVAALNHIPVRKRSWRHGSIAWRQRYLRTLVGRSCRGLGIDRLVFIIKLISLLIVAATVSFYLWAEVL